jgi:uncharacterized paraquat-inducible protein A
MPVLLEVVHRLHVGWRLSIQANVELDMRMARLCWLSNGLSVYNTLTEVCTVRMQSMRWLIVFVHNMRTRTASCVSLSQLRNYMQTTGHRATESRQATGANQCNVCNTDSQTAIESSDATL